MIPWTLIIAVTAALLLVTLIHELGHFLVAQRLGIPVKRLTVGLGPILWRRQLGQEMELVLRAVPAGMAVGVPVRRTSDGRTLRPIDHDIMLAAGGPAASMILALALGASILMFGGMVQLQLWLIATALLSVTLGVLNLIPIPGLDGGHMVLLIAARFGRELTPQQEAAAHRAGIRLTALVCILLLMVQGVRFL